MYKVLLSPRAIKELKRLPTNIRERAEPIITELSRDPFIVRQIKYIRDKRLADFRIRIGHYRILYDLYEKDRIVYVLRVGHRKDIYR